MFVINRGFVKRRWFVRDRRRAPVCRQTKRIITRNHRSRAKAAASDKDSGKTIKEEPMESEPLTMPLNGETESIGMTTNAVKYSLLKGNPLSCGVNSATDCYELPTPAVAARNLVEQVHFAHFCTIMSNKHHRRAGYPFGTLADFVCDGSGFPILRLSSLAVPTRNIIENPHSSVAVQMPGWSGLSNARVTIFGDIYRLPPELEDLAIELFARQDSSSGNILTGNTQYFRMHELKDLFFVGGFGTVQWIDVKDYINAQPDKIVTACSSAQLQELNSKFSNGLRRLLSRKSPVHDAQLISVDAMGADIRTRCGPDFGVVRVGFMEKVTTVKEAIEAFQKLAAPVSMSRKKPN